MGAHWPALESAGEVCAKQSKLASAGTPITGHAQRRWLHSAARLPGEVLASAAGFITCLVFVLHPDSPGTPALVVGSMVFTTLCCPVAMLAAPGVYRRHRIAFLLLVRLTFAYGTLHDFDEQRPWQKGDLSWPALLMSLVYNSRALVVAGWGAFGFQVPLGLFAVSQLAHVATSAWMLAPAVCRADGPFLGCAEKLQTLAMLLDWPLRVMGGGIARVPAHAACVALNAWTQLAFAFVLPTALLVWMQRQRQAAEARAAGPEAELTWRLDEVDRWPVLGVALCAAQVAWLAVRVTLAGVDA